MAYPDSVYQGITSDPDTWGMCCNEEMARECAEEYYLRTKKGKQINVGLIVCMVMLAGVAASVIAILALT